MNEKFRAIILFVVILTTRPQYYQQHARVEWFYTATRRQPNKAPPFVAPCVLLLALLYLLGLGAGRRATIGYIKKTFAFLPVIIVIDASNGLSCGGLFPDSFTWTLQSLHQPPHPHTESAYFILDERVSLSELY